MTYSFLIDSKTGYNLESVDKNKWYQSIPSYLYWLIKHFHPDSKTSTWENIDSRQIVIYEIETYICFRWVVNDQTKKIFDTINEVQPNFIKMMQDGKGILHVNLSIEGPPLIDLYSFWYKQMEQYSISPSRVIVSTCNLKEKGTYNTWCKKNNVNDKIKIIAFPYLIPNGEWGGNPHSVITEQIIKKSINFKFEDQISYKSKNTIKLFLTFNRSMHSHRKAFVAMLNYENLLENSLTSIDVFDNLEKKEWHAWDVPIEKHPAYSQENILNLQKKLPLIIDKRPWDISREESNTFYKEFYLNTWFSLVSESRCFDDHKSNFFNSVPIEYQFISEKTMRPIRAFQPFVVFGMVDTLKDLKELGFKTFDQYWNEEYDNIQDTQQRLEEIISVVKTLSNLSTDSWLQMYKDMKPILEHNYKVLMETQWLPTLDSIL
jgi:hypothetical protein